MKYFFNGLLGAMFTLLLYKSGVSPYTWNFWVIFGVFIATVWAQYIDS